MMWFQRFDDRLALEKQTVAELMAEGWVKRVDWHVDAREGIIRADIDFEAGDQLREAQLIYPFVYPFVPLRVCPRTSGERWSGHQWPSGELCLEIRADNWHPDFTARDMLISARKLLDTESQIDGNGVQLQVPSDHRFTEAQRLLGSFLRLIISDGLKAEVRRRTEKVQFLDLLTSAHSSAWIVTAVGLMASADEESWVDMSVPAQFRENPNRVGRIAVVQYGDARHLALIDPRRPAAEIWAEFSSIPFDSNGIVVGLLGDCVLAKWLDSEKAYTIAEVPMDKQQRTPERNAAAGDKRVAIIGCGSMGSKVAASLARSGVTKFMLVDDDVLTAGNLVRNDLDWTAVGSHKVDGVTARLRAINPTVDVQSWTGRLGGQHSTSSLEACLRNLTACDLIVETTGSGQGFGIAAAVATQDQVPMVWGRVFGGGFGGYLARCRPGIEAPPLDVRHEIWAWMTDPSRPKPPDDSALDYGAEADDQAAMVADDTDVSVISAHLARMALDMLRPVEASDYPYSVYLIGLRAEWIFKMPFQTFPLLLKGAVPTATSKDSTPEGEARALVPAAADPA
ncbi:ThiF family adenylyltransferase [Jeongeupia sp. USM3]|uniref:ThiF family adenylyltransferase n=1 Tax=Jeongeupia sp. USM3 TaxID=1906741 RepID=UPI00089DFD2E|nr:ThiF family adenylyltransferase [Jeongeupia sp. USM3]AOX99257.1 hypothetical protein BJP62_01590 [Jeongeupia sp. USM3]